MKIPGYNIITDNRNYSVAGGVAPYLKSNFCHRISDHLKIDGVENTWVDTQDLLIGAIYNSPNRSHRKFLDELEQVLHAYWNCSMLEDFNINTLVKN